MITASITSDDYFGARHGIESLFQLMEYDELIQDFIMLDEVSIQDEPEFSHRGINMDTSRNFQSIEVLKRIVDGMAASKVRLTLIKTGKRKIAVSYTHLTLPTIYSV